MPARAARFINNIIYFRTTDLNSAVNVGPNTLPDTFTFANNLWYAFNNPSFGGYSLPTVEINGIYRQNPLFSRLGDPAGTQVDDDFRLDRASPARAKGQSLNGLEVAGVPASDRDARRYLAVPTLGAYEIGVDGDVNGDAAVDTTDLLLMANSFGSTRIDGIYDVRSDFNGDGSVDVVDLLILADHYGTVPS